MVLPRHPHLTRIELTIYALPMSMRDNQLDHSGDEGLYTYIIAMQVHQNRGKNRH